MSFCKCVVHRESIHVKCDNYSIKCAETDSTTFAVGWHHMCNFIIPCSNLQLRKNQLNCEKPRNFSELVFELRNYEIRIQEGQLPLKVLPPNFFWPRKIHLYLLILYKKYELLSKCNFGAATCSNVYNAKHHLYTLL